MVVMVGDLLNGALFILSYLLFSKQGLDLPQILVEVENRGSSFDQLLAIPEQDGWVYADGKSVSCVAYVLQIYKAAGLFDPLSDSIEATEFTVSFFTGSSSSLVRWFLGLLVTLLKTSELHCNYCITLEPV